MMIPLALAPLSYIYGSNLQSSVLEDEMVLFAPDAVLEILSFLVGGSERRRKSLAMLVRHLI